MVFNVSDAYAFTVSFIINYRKHITHRPKINIVPLLPLHICAEENGFATLSTGTDEVRRLDL